VRVAKDDETGDPRLEDRPGVDLLLVVPGRLLIECADRGREGPARRPGDLLVLPPETRGRRWARPRDATQPTGFLAVYPTGGGAGSPHQGA